MPVWVWVVLGVLYFAIFYTFLTVSRHEAAAKGERLHIVSVVAWLLWPITTLALFIAARLTPPWE